MKYVQFYLYDALYSAYTLLYEITNPLKIKGIKFNLDKQETKKRALDQTLWDWNGVEKKEATISLGMLLESEIEDLEDVEDVAQNIDDYADELRVRIVDAADTSTYLEYACIVSLSGKNYDQTDDLYDITVLCEER